MRQRILPTICCISAVLLLGLGVVVVSGLRRDAARLERQRLRDESAYYLSAFVESPAYKGSAAVIERFHKALELLRTDSVPECPFLIEAFVQLTEDTQGDGWMLVRWLKKETSPPETSILGYRIRSAHQQGASAVDVPRLQVVVSPMCDGYVRTETVIIRLVPGDKVVVPRGRSTVRGMRLGQQLPIGQEALFGGLLLSVYDSEGRVSNELRVDYGPP